MRTEPTAGDRRDRLLGIGQRLGRIGLARLQIDEGADHLGRDVAGLGDRDVAEAGNRTGIDDKRDIHRLRGVIDDRSDFDDAGERAGFAAPVIDQCGLCRSDRGGGGGCAGHEAGNLAGVGNHRGRIATSTRNDVDIAQREQRPGGDRDHHRCRRAVAIALGRGGKARRRLAGLGHRRAIDADRDLRVEITLSPERIDQRVDIGGGAAGQGLAIGRRILAQAIEQRGVLQAAFQRAGIGYIAELELEHIRDRGLADRRWLVLAAEEIEDVERRQIESARRRNITGKHRRDGASASAS
jgi:hypothetical protein